MSTQVQHRRGTTVQHATFTGAQGEVTMDTTKGTLVVHDGATAGGIPLARADAVSSARSGVTGLVGTSSSSSSVATLSADAVALRNSAGGLFTKYNVGSASVDVTTAGPAAGGRDQAGAISNAWSYIYWIYNPTTTTMALLVSTSAPSAFTGSTLPSGYTYWAFATALYVDGNPFFRACTIKGAHVSHQNPLAVVSNGQAVSFAAVSCALYAPPNTLRARFSFQLSLVHNAISTWALTVRPTGSGSSGFTATTAQLAVAGQSTVDANWGEMPLGTSQQIDYVLSAVPSTSGGANIYLLGYSIPNGDS